MSRPPSIYMRVPAKLSPGLQCAMRSTISRTGTLARRSIFCPFLNLSCLLWRVCVCVDGNATCLQLFCSIFAAIQPQASAEPTCLHTFSTMHSHTHTHTHTYAGSCHTLRTYVCLSHLYASSTRYPVILTKISACSHTYTLPATNHWQTKHLERRHRIYSKNVQTNWHTQYQQQRANAHTYTGSCYALRTHRHTYVFTSVGRNTHICVSAHIHTRTLLSLRRLWMGELKTNSCQSPSSMQKQDAEKVHAIVARRTVPSQNVQNTSCVLEDQMPKTCIPLWREAHVQVR